MVFLPWEIIQYLEGKGIMRIKKELLSILDKEKITTLFQPIIDLVQGNVTGYEGLSRGPQGSELYTPLSLIQTAKTINKTHELDQLFIKKAIENSKKINSSKLLFINVEPDMLLNKKTEKQYRSFIFNQKDRALNSIVFEVTERTVINDHVLFKKIIEDYRNHGFKFAIDDVGNSYSSLSRIMYTQPDFIKIDMALIRDIHEDSFKQALIQSIVQFASTSGIQVIAEGIESKNELATIIRLGVHYGQGYFIGHPDVDMPKSIDKVKKRIIKINYEKNNLLSFDIENFQIGKIAEQIEPISKDIKCCSIKEIFYEMPYEGLCIVQNRKPIGLIMKHCLYAEMATQYGYSVYNNRDISLVMDSQPIIVDYFTDIRKVSELITVRENNKVYDNVIVTKDGIYYGLVSIRNLLQHITNLETDYARQLNPLTLLPGNKLINSMLWKYKNLSKTVAIVYVDLDNFKIYNDKYGFENGDNIIKRTSKILEAIINKHHPLESFIGHIGGDDFMFILSTNLTHLRSTLDDMIIQFDETILEFFNEKDKKNRKICAIDRNGKNTVFDLTSLSLGGFIGTLNSFQTLDAFGEYMGQLKKKAKKIKGNSYYIHDMHKDIEMINSIYFSQSLDISDSKTIS